MGSGDEQLMETERLEVRRFLDATAALDERAEPWRRREDSREAEGAEMGEGGKGEEEIPESPGMDDQAAAPHRVPADGRSPSSRAPAVAAVATGRRGRVGPRRRARASPTSPAHHPTGPPASPPRLAGQGVGSAVRYATRASPPRIPTPASVVPRSVKPLARRRTSCDTRYRNTRSCIDSSIGEAAPTTTSKTTTPWR